MTVIKKPRRPKSWYTISFKFIILKIRIRRIDRRYAIILITPNHEESLTKP